MDTRVQRWLQYIENQNKETAHYYNQVVNCFEKAMDINADRLLTMSEKKRVGTLEDFLPHLRNLTPKSQATYLNVMKSLLSFYRKPTRLNVRIRGINRAPTLKNERIPEHKQVREVLNRLPPRLKASAALITFTGIRWESQVLLQLEDLIDFDVKTLTFTHIPALIYIPAEKSKNGNQYFTFLIKEGCEAVEAYLRNRRSEGEDLTEESHLIARINGGKIQAESIRSKIRKKNEKSTQHPRLRPQKLLQHLTISSRRTPRLEKILHRTHRRHRRHLQHTETPT